jgi:hypothetical protein
LDQFKKGLLRRHGNSVLDHVSAKLLGTHMQLGRVDSGPGDTEIGGQHLHRLVDIRDDDANVVEVRIDHGQNPSRVPAAQQS